MKKSLCIFLSLLLCALFPHSSAKAECSAKAAAVINAQTGELIWQKNADERLPMASTTKIMTALLVCESGSLSREITVTPEMVAVEGSSMGLSAGDTVTLNDLLYGMLLASGNDAANAAAIAIGGSQSGFVALMNKRATELGLENTHFATPSGLDAPDHYTTAAELARLASAALQNADFSAAASAKTATLCFGNPPVKHTLTNHNRLLREYSDVVGVKTGFTKKSGRCLVSAARLDGKAVIAVTLNDPNDWADHRALLDMGLASLNRVTSVPQNKAQSVPVLGGRQSAVSVSLPESTLFSSAPESVTCTVRLLPLAVAPVLKGEILGRVEYYSSDRLVFTQNITASQDVPSGKTSPAAIFKAMLAGIS